MRYFAIKSKCKNSIIFWKKCKYLNLMGKQRISTLKNIKNNHQKFHCCNELELGNYIHGNCKDLRRNTRKIAHNLKLKQKKTIWWKEHDQIFKQLKRI